MSSPHVIKPHSTLLHVHLHAARPGHTALAEVDPPIVIALGGGCIDWGRVLNILKFVS